MKGYERLPDTHKNTSVLRSYCDRVIEVERAKENQRKRHGTKRQQSPEVSAAAPRTRTPGRGRSPNRSNSRHRNSSYTRSPGGTKRRRSTGRRSNSFKKVCADFLKGKCTRGAGCKYEHSKTGEKSPTRNRPPSPKDRYKSPRRSGSSPSGRFKHPCRDFALGRCK